MFTVGFLKLESRYLVVVVVGSTALLCEGPTRDKNKTKAIKMLICRFVRKKFYHRIPSFPEVHYQKRLTDHSFDKD